MHIEIDENETLPPLNLREVDLRLMSPIVPFGAVHSARLSLSAPLRYLDPSFCGRHMGIRYGQRSLPDHHLLGKLGFVSVDNEQFDMAWWRQHSPPVVFLKLARGDHIEDLGKVYGEIGLVLINDPNVNAPEKLNFMRVGMYGILTTAHGRTQSWRLEQLQEWDATEPVDLVDFDLV